MGVRHFPVALALSPDGAAQLCFPKSTNPLVNPAQRIWDTKECMINTGQILVILQRALSDFCMCLTWFTRNVPTSFQLQRVKRCPFVVVTQKLLQNHTFYYHTNQRCCSHSQPFRRHNYISLGCLISQWWPLLPQPYNCWDSRLVPPFSCLGSLKLYVWWESYISTNWAICPMPTAL